MAQSKSKKWIAFIVLTIAAGLIYRVPYLKTVFYDPLVAASRSRTRKWAR